jgi:hypothetical protein
MMCELWLLILTPNLFVEQICGIGAGIVVLSM